jgi:hypothetical protein
VRSNLTIAFFRTGVTTMQRPLLPFLAITFCVLLAACTNAPPPPSTAQYLAEARNNFKGSDFNAALINLDRAMKSTGDEALRQQAAVLRTALVTALADASKQMAEAYAVGANEPAARSQFGPFNRMRSDYYGIARSRLMDAMQSVMDQRSKLTVSPMPIEVMFPSLAGGTDPTITRIKRGLWVTDSDRLGAELVANRNALARTFSALAGAGPDPSKGQQIFSTGKVDIDPRVYLIEISSSFLQIGSMFEPRGVNEADHLRIVNQVVRDNLEIVQKLLVAKPDKDLEARATKMQTECDNTLKKLSP